MNPTYKISKFIGNWKLKIDHFLVVFIVLGVLAALSAHAFTGPSAGCAPGGSGACNGSLSLDANGNMGFGTTKISSLTATTTYNTPPYGAFQNVFMIASTSTPPGIALRNIGSGGSGNGGYGLMDATWVWQLTPWGAIALFNAGNSYGYNRNALTVFPNNSVVLPGPFGSGSGWYPATSTLNVIGDITGAGNVNITGSFIGSLSGNLSAANVSGPSAFGSNYATYNYAFPGSLAVGTSTTSGLPTSGLLVIGTTTLATVAGNVGIGTTSPSFGLDVVRGTDTYYSAQFKANTGHKPLLIYTDSGGSGITASDPYKEMVYLNPTNHYQQFFINGAEKVRIDNNGNVGIGITNPSTPLYVNGTSTLAGNVVLGSSASSLITFTGAALTDLNMNNNNVTGVNKITATTFDPLYDIGGVKYATYASAIAGGVKEEYVGQGQLQMTNDKCQSDLSLDICHLDLGTAEYQYVVDFDRVERGSDLWLWRKAVDFSPDNVEVLATPVATPVAVAYEIDGNKIIFRASASAVSEVCHLSFELCHSVDFSYRLIGNRFDWKGWPTLAPNQNEKAGLIINDK